MLNMMPILTRKGQLLGHVDADIYPRYGGELRVDDAPRDFDALFEPVPAANERECTNFVLLHMKFLRFALNLEHRAEAMTSRKGYLVADGKLPKWFWEAAGTVKFEPGQWEPQ